MEQAWDMRFLLRILKKFEDNSYLDRYILRGRHHLKWNLNDDKGMHHIDTIKKYTEICPETRQIMIESLQKVTFQDFKEIAFNLTAFIIPVRLTAERANFMLRLLQSRYQHLLHELEK